MNKYLRYTIIALLGTWLLYSDFIHDYVFINLNSQIYYLRNIEDGMAVKNYTDSWMQAHLFEKSIADIRFLKWVYSGLFTVYFWALASSLLLLIYRNKKSIIFSSIFFGGLFLIACLIFGLNYLPWGFGWQSGCYSISIHIFHFIESSLPALMLIASFKAYLILSPQKPISSSPETTDS